jgi:hypothetical protein
MGWQGVATQRQLGSYLEVLVCAGGGLYEVIAVDRRWYRC